MGRSTCQCWCFICMCHFYMPTCCCCSLASMMLFASLSVRFPAISVSKVFKLLASNPSVILLPVQSSAWKQLVVDRQFGFVTRISHLSSKVLHTEQVSSNTLARLSRDSSVTLSLGLHVSARSAMFAVGFAVQTCSTVAYSQGGQWKLSQTHIPQVCPFVAFITPNGLLVGKSDPRAMLFVVRPGWINSGFTKLRVWEQDDFVPWIHVLFDHRGTEPVQIANDPMMQANMFNVTKHF